MTRITHIHDCHDRKSVDRFKPFCGEAAGKVCQIKEGGVSMIGDERKAIMRRALEEMDIATIEKNIGPSYILHSADGTEINSPEQYIKFLTGLLGAFPDIKYKVEDIVADGNIVAIRASFTGTNIGSLRGMPPTGKKVVMKEAFFYRWEGDKVVEEWNFVNYMALMQQLGLVPSPGRPGG